MPGAYTARTERFVCVQCAYWYTVWLTGWLAGWLVGSLAGWMWTVECKQCSLEHGHLSCTRFLEIPEQLRGRASYTLHTHTYSHTHISVCI